MWRKMADIFVHIFSSKLAHGTYCLCSIMQLFRLLGIVKIFSQVNTQPVLWWLERRLHNKVKQTYLHYGLQYNTYTSIIYIINKLKIIKKKKKC